MGLRIVIGIIMIAVLAMAGLAGIQASLVNAGDDITITNETWTPDAGNYTTLDDSQRTGAFYATNVTVYDENNTLMEPGPSQDYIWNESDGQIKANTGGGLENDTSAKITYSYQQTTQEQREWATLVSKIPSSTGALLPAAIIIIAVIFLRGG